jgi:predicted transcriptional regulator
MATIRVHKTKNYTVMSNTHLRDKNLSLKAKGLLSVMLSLPNNWDYSIAGLVAISKENETAVKSALNELRDNNYVVVTKENPTKSNGGRIKYTYEVYEEPYKQKIEKQDTENLGVECQQVENHRQLNTNELSTEKLNIDNKYALSESKDSSRGDIYAFSAEKGGSKSDVIKNLAVQFADCEPSDWRIEELKHIIDYFLEQYNKTLNMSHIRITEQALTKIVINYFEPVGNYMSDNSAYGFDDYYKELIDYYLQTKYKINGKEVTKSLQHFMSGMIRENLAQKYLK